MLQCVAVTVAVCCSVLQCRAVSCSVSQCDSRSISVYITINLSSGLDICVAETVARVVAVCCSVFQKQPSYYEVRK